MSFFEFVPFVMVNHLVLVCIQNLKNPRFRLGEIVFELFPGNDTIAIAIDFVKVGLIGFGIR
jgi:hypothetical protein